MVPDEGIDGVELHPQRVRSDDGRAVHEVDVIVAGHVPVEVDADEFAQPLLEEEAAGEHVLGRRGRGISGVEVAQVDLPLVPATRGRHRLEFAVEERHVEPASGELYRDGAAHDPGPEDRDPATAHDVPESAPESATTSVPESSPAYSVGS